MTREPSAIYNTLSRLRSPYEEVSSFPYPHSLPFLALPCVTASGAEVTLDNTTAKVFFSPDGGCVKGIVKEIEMGTREILVQAYSYSSTPIRKTKENVLVVKSKALAGLYAENWYRHLKHASKF